VTVTPTKKTTVYNNVRPHNIRPTTHDDQEQEHDGDDSDQLTTTWPAYPPLVECNYARPGRAASDRRSLSDALPGRGASHPRKGTGLPRRKEGVTCDVPRRFLLLA
jgi:hypothetical protein